VTRLAPALAIVLLSVGVASAAPAKVTPAVSRHVLSNGMTILVREDPLVGVVAVSLQVRAGSLFERDETAGITNFLQRVMVRGARGRSAQAIAEAAQELGGSVEGAGDVEVAELRGEALARHWKALLDLVADIALAPTLAAEEVERERRLLVSQIQTRADMPYSGAWDALMSDLYGPHPYARAALGRVESVKTITRAALVEHHRLVYRPDRMVLAISGNVPRGRVLAAAEARFGGLAAPPAPAAAAVPSAVPTGERRTLGRPAEQAQIFVGYLGPSMSAPDYAATRVLGAVLGGGMSARLFRELRERRGLAYTVGTLTQYRTGPGFLLAYLGTTPANAEAATGALLEVVHQARAQPPSAGEVERAKAFLLGTLAMDRRTSARHAWYLAFFEVVGAGWDFPERYARAVEAVSVAEVEAAAARYLTRPTVVILRPEAAAR
jgi:zinc protease